MDFALTDEQQLIRRPRATSPHKVVRPRADENARNHHFDIDLAKLIAEQGYLGAIIPREYGGAGLDYLTYGLVVEEIGAVDSAMRTVISVQTSLVCSAILKCGTEEQKQHYLPKLCSGEWLGCFGLTEPDTGSDAANQRTRATKVDGGWKINGAKMWISMGNHAKVALVFAQTDPEKKHRGLACFLVDTDQDGYQPTEIHGKMGLHGSDTAAISLDDVFATDDQVLGEVGDGFKVAMSALDSGRFSVAAGCVGHLPVRARRVGQLRHRAQAVRPPDRRRSSSCRAMLAEMRVKTDAARLLTWRAGWLKDQGLAQHDRDVDRQVLRHRGRPVVRQRGDPGPRRRGLRRRPPGRARLPRRPRDDALRGHLADPAADHRPGADRHQRDRVSAAGRLASSAPGRWARGSPSSARRPARRRCCTTRSPTSARPSTTIVGALGEEGRRRSRRRSPAPALDRPRRLRRDRRGGPRAPRAQAASCSPSSASSRPTRCWRRTPRRSRSPRSPAPRPTRRGSSACTSSTRRR